MHNEKVPEGKQLIKSWYLSSAKAADFCRLVAPHTHLKRDQLLAAQDAVLGKGDRVKVTAADGTQTLAANISRFAVSIGKPKVTVWGWVKKGHGGGYKFERLNRSKNTGGANVELKRMLVKLKAEEHVVETMPTLAYFAGFVDADGGVGFPMRNYAGQKFPAVLDTMLQRFGGRISKVDGPFYNWACYGRQALSAIAALRPFLVNKAAQADLVIRPLALSFDELQHEMQRLKNRKRKREV